MPLYELTLKDGSTVQVEGPENASTEQLVAIANRAPSGASQAEDRLYALLEQRTPKEAGLTDYLGEVPKGLAAGAAGLLESAALGAVTGFGERDERIARRAIQSAGRGVQEYLAPDVGLEESIPRKFSEALGSFAAIGLASLIPGVGVPLAGGLAVGAGAGEASERARAAGATEEERAQATRLGAVVGAGELLPIKFIKSLGRPTTGTIIDRVKRAGASGGVEGAQEAAAGIAQNLIEQGIYNPEQGTFTNTGESAAYGAGVGAFVQAIVDLAMPGRPRGSDVSLPEEEQLALPAPDEQLALPAPEERLALPAPQARLPAPSTVVTPEGEAMTQAQADQLRREQERERAEEALIFGDMPTEEVRGAQERARREAGDEQFLRELEEAQRTDYAEAQERAREREALRAAERGDEEAFAQPDLFAMEQEQARRTLGEPVPVQEEAPTPQTPVQETQMDIMDLIAQEQQRAESEQETAAGAEITAVQQEESQRRESALQEIIAADPRRTPDIRGMFQAVLESGGLSPQLTETEERMIRRAEDLRAAEDTVPRQLPSTPEDTQLAELEAAIPQRQLRGEQLTLEGVPSRRQEKRAQRLGATEPARVEEPVEAPRPVTTEQLDAMGIPKAAPVRRRIQGRDLSAVPDQEFVRNQLTEFANAKATRPETKFKITKFLEGAPDEQLEMFGPRGGLPAPKKAKRTEPTERRRDAEPQRPEPAPSGVGVQTGGRDTEVGRTPEEVRDTERAEPPRPDRLERAERDVADVAGREGALPSALEEIATPKAVAPKRKRRSPVEVLDTARGKKPAEETKAEPAEETKVAPKAEAKPERVAMRVVSKADTKLDEAQKENVELYNNPIYNAPFKKVTKTVATDTDKTTVASLLERTADPLKSGAGKTREAPLLDMEGVLPEGTKTRNINAARMYFGKKKRIEDVIELIAYDLAAGAEGRGSYQAQTEANTGVGKKAKEGSEEFRELADVTPADEKAYFKGLGNLKAARAAYSWVLGNMSPEVAKQARKRAAHYAETEIAVDRIGKRDLIEEDRARAKELEKLREEQEEQALKPSDDKLSKEETRKLEKALGEGVDSELTAFDDVMEALAILRYGLNLTKDAVSAVAMPLHPETEVALQNGQLGLALERIAATTQNSRVRNAANKLRAALGDTKVEVVENLTNDRGQPVAGLFDPKTNTIKLDAEQGMNTHTVLHEGAHAVTSATLTNKSHPMTKKLTKLYNDVKDRLGTAYGAESLDEFVAETFGNEEFRVMLNGITPKGEKVSALRVFTNAVGNMLRRMLGMQTKPLDTALTEADKLIDAIITPAPPSRDASALYLNTTRDGILEAIKNKAEDIRGRGPVTKQIRDAITDSSVDFLTSTVPDTARNILLRVKDMVSLADTAQKLGLGRAGFDLFTLLNKQRGKIHSEDEKVRAEVKKLSAWARKAGLEKRRAFSRVIYSHRYGATIHQVDPMLTEEQARKAYKNDAEKFDIWKEQRADWDAIGPEGQKQYKDLLEFYRKKYQEFKEVINGQLDEVLKNNPEAAKRLKNELFERFFKNAELQIYFPLTRSGKFKVTYTLKEGAVPKGMDPYVVEMLESKNERKRVIAELRNNPDVDQDSITQVDGDLKVANFKTAPPTSFVKDVIGVLDANGVDGEVIEEIARMFIESLPETALAKSMQKRKNVLGYVTDPIEAMRTKGYDLSRQIERMRFNGLLTSFERRVGEIKTPTYNKIQAVRKAMPGVSKAKLAEEMETTVEYVDMVDELYVGATTDAQKDAAAEKVGNVIRAIDDVKTELMDRAKFGRAGAGNKGIEKWVKFLNQNAFLFTIGFNPSSAAVQLAQIPGFVAPYYGAEYGYKKATQTLLDAAKVVGAFNNDLERYYDVKEDGTFVVKKDIKIPKGMEDVIKEMTPLVQTASEMGLLNRSFILDAVGLEESGRKRNILDMVVAGSAYMFNRTEMYNRQVALLAAYKLELDKLRAQSPNASLKELQQKAVERAVILTQETNTGAVLETGPSLTREGIGRVAGMYKTYGLRMYATMLKSAAQFREDLKANGVKSAIADTAFKQLLGIHGTAIFFAGIHGVPLYGAVQLFADLFLLGDDEDDFNTLVRKAVGEDWYKGAINSITGLDIANRIRLTGLVIQENRFNNDPSPEEWLGFHFGGPALSVGKRLLNGVRNINDGEIERGIELLMPAGVTNMYKSAFGRYQDDGGIYTRRQDPIYGDMTTGELVAQFFGFPPAEYIFRQERNIRDKRVDTAVNVERTKLLRKYYVASRMGDYESMTEALSEISKFNGKHPTAAIDNKTIDRSMKKHAETSLTMYDGVSISPLMRFAIEQSRMEYGDPSGFFK
jgi:hypothetical protein